MQQFIQILSKNTMQKINYHCQQFLFFSIVKLYGACRILLPLNLLRLEKALSKCINVKIFSNFNKLSQQLSSQSRSVLSLMNSARKVLAILCFLVKTFHFFVTPELRCLSYYSIISEEQLEVGKSFEGYFSKQIFFDIL